MNEAERSTPSGPGAGPPGARPGAEGVLRWDPWIRGIFVGCIAFEVLWVILDQTIAVSGWIDNDGIQKIFHLSMEENAPTWFASTQASLAALTAFAIYGVTRVQGGPRWTRRGWLGVGFVFAYISVDDTAKLHERIGSAITRLLKSDPEGQIVPIQWLLSIDTYSWQRTLAPVFAVVGICVVLFLWRHFGRYRLRGFVVAAVLCFAVAVGIDFLEGRDDFFLELSRSLRMSEDFVRHNCKVVEETLEMFGTTLFWQGLLRYLAQLSDGFVLRMVRS